MDCKSLEADNVNIAVLLQMEHQCKLYTNLFQVFFSHNTSFKKLSTKNAYRRSILTHCNISFILFFIFVGWASGKASSL